MIGEFLGGPKVVSLEATNNSSETTHLGHTVLHDLLASQILLVTHKEFVNTLRCISVDFLKPLLDIREGVYACSNKRAIQRHEMGH